MIQIFIFYLFSSIIFTYPLATKLGDFLPGQPNDAYVYLWNIWSFWNQILTSGNVFYSNYVMYPIGANLFFHTYAPLVSIFALPLLNNLSIFMGLAILFAVTLSSLSAYILCFKLSSNKYASLIGGLIYGVSPIIHSFIESQHYYFLFSSIYYPLGIYLLVMFFEGKKIKYMYYSLGLFWLVILTDYYSAVLYSLLILIFFLINERFNIKRFFKYIVAGSITLIFPFLFFYNTEKNFRNFIQYEQPINSSSTCNTNLLGFITPNINNPILAVKQKINLDTPSYFLGWGILMIAILSAYKYRKTKYVTTFSIIFVVFFLLSLGTSDKFNTPFYYFLKIPILGAIDCPIRFPIILQLCISILITYFISNKRKYIQAAIAIFILLLIEYSVINKNFSSTEIPLIYKKIKLDNNKKTVLEIPSGITESKSAFGYDWSIQALHSQQMYWQTSYNKPRVGVYMSRLTPDKYSFFRNEPIISNIFNYSSAGGTKPTFDLTDNSINDFIIKFNLGYIVLTPNIRQPEFSMFIENEFKNQIKEKISIDGFILYKL